MRTHLFAIGLTIASASIVACTAQARSPEPVLLDCVECARCRMLVSDEAGAAQVVSSAEDTRFYDDIGCLAADWRARRNDATPFVRTGGGAWIDARTASFARPATARTAMGSGLAAYASPGDARAAGHDGRALTWDEIVRNAGERR